MNKLTYYLKKRAIPFFLITLIFTFAIFHDYNQAYATNLPGVIPESGAWSAYDILYTLFNSIGITIQLDPPESDAPGALPAPWDKTAQDAYFDSILEWQYSTSSSVDIADEKLQGFVDELKALPENIHDGCISISQDLWNFLNNYGYEATETRINVDNAVVAGIDVPFFYTASCFNPDLVLDFYLSTNELCFVYTKVYQNGKYYYTQYAVSDTAFTYVSTSSNVINPSFNRYPSGSYNGYYYASLGAGLFSDAYLIGYEISSIPDFINSLSGDLAINAPDVIWPDTDLAYDIVNHVATWDDALANDLISTAEDDDTVAVIPLTDTGVGEDVFTNVGVTDIPGTGEDVKNSEATDEDAKKETVDQSVIATLPDSAAKAGDITKYFPFCIPFDLVSMIKGMQADQKPPVWSFKFHFKTINYTFEVTVDMSDYEKYIKIFRAGIVIFYIIIMMLVTIRYSSGIVKD